MISLDYQRVSLPRPNKRCCACKQCVSTVVLSGLLSMQPLIHVTRRVCSTFTSRAVFTRHLLIHRYIVALQIVSKLTLVYVGIDRRMY